MKILVIDVGGTHIKLLGTGQQEPIKIPSGPTMTPKTMVADVKKETADWEYDVVSIGYPGPVIKGKIVSDPHNLGSGWVGFDFERAFGRPVKVINDAAMQALGSYKGGHMLFIGLGTGLGAATIMDGVIGPMEIAHLPYKKGRTFEDYLGSRGLKRRGEKKWRKSVADVVQKFSTALEADDVVIGGGNAKKLEKLPPGARLGSNANAFKGGFKLWDEPRPRRT